MQSIKIRTSTFIDYDPIIGLLHTANNYSESKPGGIRQWNKIDYVVSQIQQHIRNKELYVAIDSNEKIIGSIAITDNDSFWFADDAAVYIHKLMKEPSVKNLGAYLIFFAAEIAHQRNKTLLRCDVKESLPGLISYYNRIGFKKVGQATYGTTSETACLLEASTTAVLEKCHSLLQ